VFPVVEFEAQEFTTFAVGIKVGTILDPSTLTTETPFTGVTDQFPLGTYDVTFVPLTNTDSELDGWQDPCGGGGVPATTLKLSDLLFGFVKLMTLGSLPEIVVEPPC